MAKGKRYKRNRSDKKGSARWQVGLLAGLSISGFIVLALAGSVFFFNRQDQGIDQAAQQQAVDEAIASLPVEPRVGALAPDFTLEDTNGNEVALSDFRGQPVVVTFFHTW